MDLKIIFMLKLKNQLFKNIPLCNFRGVKVQRHKHWYLFLTWSDKTIKGTVVNCGLPSLHIGSPEIALTVPLTKLEMKTKSLIIKKERILFNC